MKTWTFAGEHPLTIAQYHGGTFTGFSTKPRKLRFISDTTLDGAWLPLKKNDENPSVFSLEGAALPVIEKKNVK